MDATLNEPHYVRVSRIMYSLKQSLDKLDHYYHALEPIIVNDAENVDLCIFPSIRAYCDEKSNVIHFEYIKPLERDPTCVTFLARTNSDSEFPKDIVVKFVDRYGAEPHRLLAKDCLAPELFYYGPIGCVEGDPSYGHLRMVVMEYIDGKTVDQVKQLPSKFLDDIRRALKILHEKNYVFGDLREPNIIITKNHELRLIDFDWAGEAMKSQYPALMSSNVSWPKGVEALSIMEIEHDNQMLAILQGNLKERPTSDSYFLD